MQKRILVNTLASLVMSVLMAGSAQAASMVGGWDFSQYFTAGFLTTDGATVTDTLDANYSAFGNTTYGPDAAAFGTMYIDGSFGSTDVDETQAGPDLSPQAGSLASNLSEPLGLGVAVTFEALADLVIQGQQFASDMSMVANQAVSAVFEVATGGSAASDWVVSFAGAARSGVSSLTVEFSTDGVNYGSATSVSLGADARTEIALSSASTDTAYVRFNLEQEAVIDQVSISASVPEPGTLVLLGAGVLGLVAFGRRREA